MVAVEGIIIATSMHHSTSTMRSLPEAESAFKARRMEEEEGQDHNQTQAQIQALMKRYSQIRMISLSTMSTMRKKISRERLMKSSTA